MAKKRKAKAKQVPKTFQRELSNEFRHRAQKSADIIRALLFAVAAGSLGFLLSRSYTTQLYFHYASLLLFIAAGLLVIVGWDIQKSKSIRRYVLLRDAPYSKFLENEKKIKDRWWSWNETIDRVSIALLILAVASALPPFFANVSK